MIIIVATLAGVYAILSLVVFVSSGALGVVQGIPQKFTSRVIAIFAQITVGLALLVFGPLVVLAAYFDEITSAPEGPGVLPAYQVSPAEYVACLVGGKPMEPGPMIPRDKVN